MSIAASVALIRCIRRGAGRPTVAGHITTAVRLAPRRQLAWRWVVVSTMGKRTSASLLRESIEIHRKAPLRLHSKSLRPRFTEARFQTDASSVRRLLGGILAGEHQ